MRSNVAEKKPLLYTHEGAVAVYASPEDQLRRSVMSNMLFEDEFYEDGQEISKRIESSVAELIKTRGGADTVANIAFEARTKMKLRHVPLLLLVSLIRANTAETRAIVAGAIAHVIQRPDELGELVSLFWKQSGGRKMLPNQMKKGLALALDKFNEYSLAKYDMSSAAVKLRDVLFLSHAKPAGVEKADLYKRIAANELKTPDTWEVALSGGADKKETFTRLLTEGNLGALALLRNLRNMTEAGVETEVIREGLGKMKTERVLPFRFITAARYAPSFEPQLEEAMFRCLASFTKFPGKTTLCIDTSASMSAKVSGKSEISRRDAAAALAMMLREICGDCEVIAFGTQAAVVRPRRGFALNDEIGSGRFGHGTNIGEATALAATKGYDRIIVITDEQSATPTKAPEYGTKGYFINVASNKNGIGYGAWTHIDGWSEAVIDYIARFEGLEGEE
jgi:60 kDa SS-A/Ro ribonucleoprotein